MPRKSSPQHPQVLPPSIKIAGYDIKIEYTTFKDDYGCSLLEEKMIQISNKIDEEDQWATLFHECIHMAMLLGGIDFTVEERTAEGFVRCMESLLWPILKFREESIKHE